MKGIYGVFGLQRLMGKRWQLSNQEYLAPGRQRRMPVNTSNSQLRMASSSV